MCTAVKCQSQYELRENIGKQHDWLGVIGSGPWEWTLGVDIEWGVGGESQEGQGVRRARVRQPFPDSALVPPPLSPLPPHPHPHPHTLTTLDAALMPLVLLENANEILA